MPGLYVVLLVLVAFSAVLRLPAGKRIRLPYPAFVANVRRLVDSGMNTSSILVTLVGLIGLFALHLFIIARMDNALNPAGFMEPHAPVLMASYGSFLGGLNTRLRHLFDVSEVLVATLETALLFVLYRRLENRRVDRSIGAMLIIGALCLYGLAIFAHANCSADVYGYISSAKYGATAYSPGTHAPFTGNFTMLNDIDKNAWKVLAPCPYGPLWLGLSSAVLAYATTVWQAIVVERCISAIAVLLCGWAIFRIRGSVALAFVFLFNPMILFNFVVEAHNDILALACVLLAAVSFRKPYIGLLWQAAAGLIKLPYLLIGILAAQAQRSVVVRIGSFTAAALITVVVSSIFGGVDYLHALLFHVQENGQQHHVVPQIAHFLLLLACLAFLAAAALRRAYFREAVPSLLALTATIYPWYLALLVPYIVIGDIAPVAYFATLPMSSLFFDILLGTKLVKLLLISIAGVGLYVASGRNVRRAQVPEPA